MDLSSEKGLRFSRLGLVTSSVVTRCVKCTVITCYSCFLTTISLFLFYTAPRAFRSSASSTMLSKRVVAAARGSGRSLLAGKTGTPKAAVLSSAWYVILLEVKYSIFNQYCYRRTTGAYVLRSQFHSTHLLQGSRHTFRSFLLASACPMTQKISMLKHASVLQTRSSKYPPWPSPSRREP